MQNSDWLMKVLVALLVVATWGLLLRSFFPVGYASAAKKTLVLCAIDDQGRYRFDGGGSSIGLTGTGLANALEAAERQGKTVHSVVVINGSYVVLAEK